MANDLGANPWVIDTPGASVLFKHEIRITQLAFCEYTTGPTDQVIVEDQNGHLVWEANGNTDKDMMKGFDCGWVNGLIVPTLTSGKLLIYIK